MINIIDTSSQILSLVYLNNLLIDEVFLTTLEAKHNYLVSIFDTKHSFSKVIDNLEDSYNLMKSEFLTETVNFDFSSVQDYISNLLALVEGVLP